MERKRRKETWLRGPSKVRGALVDSRPGSFSCPLQGMSSLAFSHQNKPLRESFSTWRFYSSTFSVLRNQKPMRRLHCLPAADICFLKWHRPLLPSKCDGHRVRNTPDCLSLPTPEGLPRWHTAKDPACQCRRHKRPGFDPWVGKIPQRRAWQPTPIFLPGESHEQRSLADYSP